MSVTLQPSCDVQSAVESWLHGVGLPEIVLDGVQPFSIEQPSAGQPFPAAQPPIAPVSSLHGLAVPMHWWVESSHWQPTCAAQSRLPKLVCVAQLKAVPEQLFTVTVQPGMAARAATEQSTYVGVPTQWGATLSLRQRLSTHPNPVAQRASDVHCIPS